MCAAAAVLGTAAAGAAVVEPGPTAARDALVTRAQLGHGWSASPAPRSVPSLTCAAFDPPLTRIRTPARAVSATFHRTASGPFVSQVADAFATAAQAEAFWRRVAVRGLLKCLSSGLVAASTPQVSLRVTRAREQPPEALGVPTRSFAVTAQATRTGSTSAVYLDAVLLRHGTVVTEVSTTTVGSPPRRALELRVGRLIARLLVQLRA